MMQHFIFHQGIRPKLPRNRSSEKQYNFILKLARPESVHFNHCVSPPVYPSLAEFGLYSQACLGYYMCMGG